MPAGPGAKIRRIRIPATRTRRFRTAAGIILLVLLEISYIDIIHRFSPRHFNGALIIAFLLGAAAAVYLAYYATAATRITGEALKRFSTGALSDRLYFPEADDELGQALHALNKLLDRLEDMLARQRRFVGSVSHDIRTPLTIIKGDIEVALLKERTPAEYQEILISNLEEVERITKLVEDLVTLARADYGELGLSVKAVPLALLLTEVREKFHEAAAAAGLKLSVNIEHDLVVEGDRERLKQLFSNLVDNAVNFTPAGGSVEISLFAEKELSQSRKGSFGKAAKVQIKDTGYGIDEKDLPHIFEPFYRSDRSRPAGLRTRHQAYGLGLAICDFIIKAHHGRIQVESQKSGKDQGSTFIVTLPLAPAASLRMSLET